MIDASAKGQVANSHNVKFYFTKYLEIPLCYWNTYNVSRNPSAVMKKGEGAKRKEKRTEEIKEISKWSSEKLKLGIIIDLF